MPDRAGSRDIESERGVVRRDHRPTGQEEMVGTVDPNTPYRHTRNGSNGDDKSLVSGPRCRRLAAGLPAQPKHGVRGSKGDRVTGRRLLASPLGWLCPHRGSVAEADDELEGVLRKPAAGNGELDGA